MTAASLSPASLLLSKAVKEGESLCLFVGCDFFSAVNLAPARSQMSLQNQGTAALQVLGVVMVIGERCWSSRVNQELHLHIYLRAKVLIYCLSNWFWFLYGTEATYSVHINQKFYGPWLQDILLEVSWEKKWKHSNLSLIWLSGIAVYKFRASALNTDMRVGSTQDWKRLLVLFS